MWKKSQDSDSCAKILKTLKSISWQIDFLMPAVNAMTIQTAKTTPERKKKIQIK